MYGQGASDGGEFRLLTMHMQKWAVGENRAADTGLLTMLLDMRSTYDELPPTFWPTSSTTA